MHMMSKSVWRILLQSFKLWNRQFSWNWSFIDLNTNEENTFHGLSLCNSFTNSVDFLMMTIHLYAWQQIANNASEGDVSPPLFMISRNSECDDDTGWGQLAILYIINLIQLSQFNFSVNEKAIYPEIK